MCAKLSLGFHRQSRSRKASLHCSLAIKLQFLSYIHKSISGSFSRPNIVLKVVWGTTNVLIPAILYLSRLWCSVQFCDLVQVQVHFIYIAHFIAANDWPKCFTELKKKNLVSPSLWFWFSLISNWHHLCPVNDPVAPVHLGPVFSLSVCWSLSMYGCVHWSPGFFFSPLYCSFWKLAL